MLFIPRTLTILLCITCITLSAQDPGFRRPSVKYRQINTDTIRIIYPEGTDETAQRIAHLISLMGRQRPFTAGAPLRKIDILLQNATDVPNGYVGLGPWRSEFYLTPPQSSFELGSLQWHDLLTIHEFRHVQQTSAMRKGISKWFYYLFGEEAFSGAKNLAVPDWFIEGDAVVAETVLTLQGRGRLPAFTNAFREMVRDGHYWKYDKVRNGSLKEFIPSEYPLGFLLANYGREKYSQQFWDSITIEAASYKGLIYSFSNALKRRTGINTKEFYHNAMDHYHNLWYGPASSVPLEGTLGGGRYQYRDLSYPVYSADGELHMMIQEFDKIPAIYKSSDGILEKVATPGFQTEPVFNAGGGKLCWTELRRHPRWWREDYSVIVVFDDEKNTKRAITHGSSYFMPALSSDGTKIAALFDNDMQEYALHILSTETGDVILTLPNPENSFFTHPQWSADDRFIITAARLSDGGMTLLSYDLTENNVRELVAPGYAPIGRPHIAGEWVYFSMPSENIDQIFRVHRSARYFEQITFDDASKYEPTINQTNGELVYARYSLSGKTFESLNLDTTSLRLVRKEDLQLSDPVIEENERNILSIAQTVQFQTTKYPLLTRPIRLHSWSLNADDPVLGIELLSENTLNTIQWRSGWDYNRNSGDHGPFTELSFGLWYPEIVAGFSGTRLERTIQNREFVWWQHVTNAGLRIPFYGYQGPYSQHASVSSRFNHIGTSGDVDFQFDFLSHTLEFTNARRQALQHPESRFSQAIGVRLLHSIDTTTASQYFVATDFTIPSPIRNHLFGIEFDYRQEFMTNTVRFADVFKYASGYEPIETDEIWRLGISYQFPVAYPDFGIGGIVYFRRIRLAPFFDLMRADGINYKSVGSECILDINVFNVEPISIGIRWARRLDLDEGNEFSLILPIGF